MRKKSRTEYSVLNIITGLGGYALNTVLGLVCRMVFTRTLSAEYLGVSGLFTNILSMLSLAELGIGRLSCMHCTSLWRSMTKKKSRP